MRNHSNHGKAGSIEKPFTILFRIDANYRIGFGHLNRCLTLAKVLSDSGGNPVFVFGKETSGIISSRMNGYPCHFIPDEIAFEHEADYITEIIPVDPNVVVLDISHSDTRNHLSAFENFLSRLSELFSSIALIDAVGPQALRFHFPSLPVSMIIAPYYGCEFETFSFCRILNGLKYFVLPKEYQNLSKRRIAKDANRILVTCGGADPAGISLKILSALMQQSCPFLSIRVVVGPLFQKTLSLKIHKMTRNMNHKVEIVNEPESLLSHMTWCDIAVGASGLTKYELAATGTPAILLSVDQEHDEINRSFALLGTVKDMGVYNTVSSEGLFNEIVDLLKNFKVRKKMSENGRNLLDGKGASRILAELRRLVHDNATI